MPGHVINAMFHSTAMVPDYDLAIEQLGALFGLRVLEYSIQSHPSIGRLGGMNWVGDGSLEIGQPTLDGGAPDRFVRRTGGGMQGVGLWVEDFAATEAHLAANGVPMPVSLGRFGFSSPRATAGLQFEWCVGTTETDPRLGHHAEPPFVQPPLLDITHQAFVGAVVADPLGAAHEFSANLGLDVLFENPNADAGVPVAGLSLGDCALALYSLLPDRSLELWGRHHDRPRIHLVGLRVNNLESAKLQLESAGVHVLRAEPHLLVLDPADTAQIEVAVVDELLPGDPRLVA